jgi:hypothetical protein
MVKEKGTYKDENYQNNWFFVRFVPLMPECLSLVASVEEILHMALYISSELSG